MGGVRLGSDGVRWGRAMGTWGRHDTWRATTRLQHGFHNKRGLGITLHNSSNDIAHRRRVTCLGLRLLQQVATHVQQRHGCLPRLRAE